MPRTLLAKPTGYQPLVATPNQFHTLFSENHAPAAIFSRVSHHEPPLIHPNQPIRRNLT